MHELPLVKSIYQTVLKHANANHAAHVNRVVLEIGALRDFIPELVQKYWDYLTPNTILDGSTIEIEEIPITIECGECHHIYPLDMNDIANAKCPLCGFESGNIITGKELNIKGIEIVKESSNESINKGD